MKIISITSTNKQKMFLQVNQDSWRWVYDPSFATEFTQLKLAKKFATEKAKLRLEYIKIVNKDVEVEEFTIWKNNGFPVQQEIVLNDIKSSHTYSYMDNYYPAENALNMALNEDDKLDNFQEKVRYVCNMTNELDSPLKIYVYERFISRNDHVHPRFTLYKDKTAEDMWFLEERHYSGCTNETLQECFDRMKQRLGKS